MKKFILIVGTFLCVSSIIADGAKYLIITSDAFYNAIQPLAQWKQKKGLQTKIAKLSETGHTRDSIKAFIQNAYNTWNPRPEYVLLVGSPNLLPGWSNTDDPYADMAGNYLIELSIGRFPCTNISECNTMVAKILGYEQTPLIIDTLWFKKVTGIIKEDYLEYPATQHPDTVYWNDMHYIFGLWRNAGYVYIDSFCRAFNDSASEVIDAINSGRTFVVFRDRATVNWPQPFKMHPNLTSNGFKLPVVISGSCVTISVSSNDYLGDSFLRVGSATNPKGAVGYFGTTLEPSGGPIARLRGTVTQGFFRSVFVDNVYKLGDVTKRAKFIIDSIQPPYYDSDRYKEWTLLGDPELNLWTAVPQLMVASYPSNIYAGPQSFTVSVERSSPETPIAHALVCVMKSNEVYESQYTDINGLVNFSINPLTSGQMYVTVTARNYRPCEDSCYVEFEPINSEATYPNQGLHLDRVVNTEYCQYVYQGNNSITWRNEDFGQTVTLDQGKYPSIADDENGLSWVCYTDEVQHRLYCQIKRSKYYYDWKKTGLVHTEDCICAPSLALSTGAYGSSANMGYVVYATINDDVSTIHFCAFDSGGVYYDTILASGTHDVSVLAPSIAITPKDLIHVVWQRKEQGGEISRIYYITTLEGVIPDDIRQGHHPRWSGQYPVSYAQGYTTEPASNPFVDAYGDRAYVVWRGPYNEANSTGEIWQRSGQIRPGELPLWQNPWDVSGSQDQESDYPVTSLGNFVAWQEYEHDNWEIKLRYKDDPIRNIRQTETDSKYPHINVKYSEEEAPIIYFIWTETVVPDRLYDVSFLPYNYGSGRDNTDELIYYSVNPGSSTQSTYCEHRDGYIPYPNYPIDFGNQSLSYRLDYLNPAYYYKARAIVYHNASGLYRQIFSFDSTSNTTIAFQPGIPETVEVIIPKNSYRQDFKSILTVTRNRGNFSSLASFDICQFEINDTTGSGSGAQSVGNVSASLISFQNFPNPFKTNTKIQFSITNPTHVALKIYNSNGQLMRTLLDETRETGTYNIVWDGRDKQNRLLTAGVYFYRLETNGYSQTKKVVLTR